MRRWEGRCGEGRARTPRDLPSTAVTVPGTSTQCRSYKCGSLQVLEARCCSVFQDAAQHEGKMRPKRLQSVVFVTRILIDTS